MTVCAELHMHGPDPSLQTTEAPETKGNKACL